MCLCVFTLTDERGTESQSLIYRKEEQSLVRSKRRSGKIQVHLYRRRKVFHGLPSVSTLCFFHDRDKDQTSPVCQIKKDYNLFDPFVGVLTRKEQGPLTMSLYGTRTKNGLGHDSHLCIIK